MVKNRPSDRSGPRLAPRGQRRALFRVNISRRQTDRIGRIDRRAREPGQLGGRSWLAVETHTWLGRGSRCINSGAPTGLDGAPYEGTAAEFLRYTVFRCRESYCTGMKSLGKSVKARRRVKRVSWRLGVDCVEGIGGRAYRIGRDGSSIVRLLGDEAGDRVVSAQGLRSSHRTRSYLDRSERNRAVEWMVATGT